jgi:hypothetical protein
VSSFDRKSDTYVMVTYPAIGFGRLCSRISDFNNIKILRIENRNYEKYSNADILPEVSGKQ